MSSTGPEFLDEPIVARILGSPGGRRLLELTEEEMRQFLSSAEITLTVRSEGDAQLKQTIDDARAALHKPVDLFLEGTLPTVAGLVGAVTVLEEQAYTVQKAAGVSGGAVVATLLVAGYGAGELKDLLLGIDYAEFKSSGRWPLKEAPYSVAKLRDWLAELLDAKGVATFADLATEDADLRYAHRLQVLVSDLDASELLVLPRDASRLGLDPNELDVSYAVAASTAAPTVFDAIEHQNPQTRGVHYLVDGSLLSNFPVWLFDVEDGRLPEWPTFGVRIVEGDPLKPIELGPRRRTKRMRVEDLAARLAEAQAASANRLFIPAEQLARTIAIPNLGTAPADFDLTTEQALQLFEAGRYAASHFLGTWNFAAYTAAFRGRNDRS